MLSIYSYKTERIHTEKFTFQNINFKEKKFYSLKEKIFNIEYFNTFPERLKKLYTREYFDYENIPNNFHTTFPFGLFLARKSVYFTGKIRVRFHIQNHKNFGVDIYLYNYWGGYDAKHLKELSPLDFDFYLDLLFEKISYSSNETITFFMEIDFNLEGKVYRDESFSIEEEYQKNLEFERDQYLILFYR